MSKDKEVEEWREKIKLSNEYRQEYGYSDEWDTFYKYYTSQWSDSIIPVNMVFAIARSIIPRVYFRNPRIVVSPTKPGMHFMSQVVEDIDNWLVHRIRIKEEMKKIILDTFLYGTGIIKTGYDSEYGYTVPEEAREKSEMEQEFQQRYEKYINPFDKRIEYDSSILPGMPWAKRVHPRDFGLPWGYTEIQNSPWVWHRIMRLVEDVKEDPKYENTENLSPTHRVLQVGDEDATDENTRPRSQIPDRKRMKYVEMFEISDLRDGKIKTIATGHDKFLRNEEDPLLLNGHKYFSMQWNENPEAFWAIPDVKIIEPQQLELNEIRTQYQEHRKFAILKLLLRKGAFDDKELDRLKNGEAGGVVEVKGDLSNAIEELKPYLTNDLLNAAEQVRRDIRETVGFSRNQMGDFDTSSRRTATEARIVQKANQIRVDERRDMAADMLVDVVERMNQYIFKFWDKPRVAKILGPSNAQEWVSFTGPQIRGQYSMRIDPDTARAVSSERRKQEAHQLLKTVSQFMKVAPDKINIGELLRYVASQYEGIDPNRFLNIPQGQSSQKAPVPLQEMQRRGQQQQQGQGQQQQLMQQLMQQQQQGQGQGRAQSPSIQQMLSALGGGGQ